MKKEMSISILVLASLNLGAAYGQQISAKALFFNSDGSSGIASTSISKSNPSRAVRKPSTTTDAANGSSSLGVSYFVRLVYADGSYSDVSATRKFATGDKFKLGLQLNRASFVYVFNKGASGKTALIYPQTGQNNRAEPMKTIFVPGGGSFRFQTPPGQEELWVYLTQSPLPDDPTTIVDRVQDKADVVADRASPRPQESSKGGSSANIQVAAYTAVPGAVIAKDIAFENDDSPTAGKTPASYVVKTNLMPNDGLFLKIRLMHE